MVNYAQYAGIHSEAAAIAFAIVYVPLLVTYVFKSFRRPNYVHIVLCLFCSVRIASFVLRALLASSATYGSNESIFISEMVLYSVGFFGVLYSTYTLILDRELLAGTRYFLDSLPGIAQLVMRLSRNRQLVRIALIIAVIFGVTGATQATSGSASALQSSTNDRAVSVYIFLAVATVTALQAIILFMSEGNTQYQIASTGYAGEPVYIRQPTFGARHGAPLLLLISLFLIVREAFYTATAHNPSKQDNEVLFYVLSAAPELLAVLLLATPGLVPSRNELPKRESLSMVQRVLGQEPEAVV